MDFDEPQASRFLTLLDESATQFTFQTFDDDRTRHDRSLARILHGPLEEHFEHLCRLNAAGAGVFVTVNETDGLGRKLPNITRIRAVWQEADRGDEPALPCQPHVTVSTSPGKFHRYIFTDTKAVAEADAVQMRLVESYGSDPSAKDRARVLRLPGFWHMKNPAAPFLVRIVEESGALPFSWEEVKRLFPPLERRAAPMPGLHAGKGKGKKPDAGSLARAEEAMGRLSPDLPYGDWLKVGMALHSAYEGSSAGLDAWDAWSAGGATYRPGECAYRWSTFAPGAVGLGTLLHLAGPSPQTEGFPPEDGPPEESPPEDDVPLPTDDDLAGSKGKTRWICTEKGKLKSCKSNARKHFELAGVAASMDTFSTKRQWRGKPLEEGTIHEEVDRLEVETGIVWEDRHVLGAIELLCAKHPFDPLADYLGGLKWDGIERAETMLCDALGAENTPLVRQISRNFLVGAVARALHPGCLHRMVLVLVGKQNIGKSRFSHWLCPNGDWFSDSLPRDLGSKDAALHTAGKWIIESPELSSFARSEMEAIKAFVSRRTERYRPPYGRLEIFYQRRCVLIGTTNSDTPLPQDDQGTRFFPVRVESQLNDEYTTDYVRDQLWAEAVELKRQGLEWWEYSSPLRAELEVSRINQTQQDAWQDILQEKLHPAQAYTVLEAARLIGIHDDRLEKAAQMRIAVCLRAMGWTRARVGHAKTRAWRYK